MINTPGNYGVLIFTACPIRRQDTLTKKDMKPGKLFFLVRARERDDFLKKDSVLLFGTNEYLRKAVLSVFPFIVKEDEARLIVRSGDAVLEFYYGAEEVIDRCVLVEILFSDQPETLLHPLCSQNQWHIFDIDTGIYMN